MEKTEDKTKMVAYRLTQEDKDTITELKKAYGLSASEFIRRAIRHIAETLPPLADVATPNPN